MLYDDTAAQVWRQTATAYLAALKRIFLVEDQPAWPGRLRSRAALRKAPKRHFVDPSLAAAALRASPGQLLADTNTLRGCSSSPRSDRRTGAPTAFR